MQLDELVRLSVVFLTVFCLAYSSLSSIVFPIFTEAERGLLQREMVAR